MFATPWTTTWQASLSFTVFCSLLKLMSIESMRLSNRLVLSQCQGLFQHQGLFQWVSSSHQVAKVLELQLQHQSFRRIFRVDFWVVQSLCNSRDSQHCLHNIIGSVAQSCPTLWDLMDCIPPGSSVHEILQARIGYWNELLFPPSMDLPYLRIKPPSLVSPSLVGRLFTIKPLGKP